MPDATARSHSDAWVNEDEPHHNHGKGNRLWLRSGASGRTRRIFISFAKPFPHNPTLVVISATLRLWVRDTSAWGGTHTITARRVTETWKENRITWANQPDPSTGTDPTEADRNTVSPHDGDELDIDVTDLMEDVAAGGKFFGFRLTIDDDNAFPLYSSDAGKEIYHPRLDVEWAFPPYPPVDLAPTGGDVIGTATPTFTWGFNNPGDDQDQSASQVQINDSASFATPPDFDSGRVTNTHHNFRTLGTTTIPDGATRWWRVRIWDDNSPAQTSQWSDVAKFSYEHKGTLSFVNPGPSHTVDDLTPDIEWSFTGRTQDRASLTLWHVHDNGTTDTLHTYPMEKNDQNHLTIPRKNKHPIIKTGKNYRLLLRVWDNFDRVKLPNDKPYVEASTNFTYARSGTPPPVTAVTASPFVVGGENSPGVLLEWFRAATPDLFTVRARGVEVIHGIEPLDVYAGSPGHYAMVFWEATVDDAIVYEVEAHETNHGNSDGNDTDTFTVKATGIWLIDDDADDAVQIMGIEQPDFTLGESATTYNPVGNRRPVRITDAIRGYEGSFSGIVLSDNKRDMLIDLKGRDKELRLMVNRVNIPVYLEEVSVAPTPMPDRHVYQVSVGFFQTDEFPDIED